VILVAAPILLAGTVVAVFYAEGTALDGRAEATAFSAEIDVLARYAANRLEGLTAAWMAAHRPVIIGQASPVVGRASAPRPPEPANPTPSAEPRDSDSDAEPPPALRAPEGVLTGKPGLAEAEERARRLAKLLVSEVRMYYEAEVIEGRRQRDLLTRLSGVIDQARRLYRAQAPSALGERVEAPFEHELLHTLAGGDAGALGR
jgi:hypothetical protein